MADASLVAIIPARGGSKRLPGKNTLDFFGHPMLAYGVAAARNSGLFSRVIVSTDDSTIGRIAEWYGAEYLARPAKLASDEAGLAEVVLHALEWLRAGGASPAAVCQLMPNCPLRRSEDVREHHRLFMQCGAPFQISVVAYRAVYPHWAMVADGNGHGQWLFGERFRVASQSLQPAYCPSGAIWWGRTEEIVRQHAFYGAPFTLAQMDANRGIDIDSREDLELAELVVRGLEQRDGRSPLEPVGRQAFAAQVRP